MTSLNAGKIQDKGSQVESTYDSLLALAGVFGILQSIELGLAYKLLDTVQSFTVYNPSEESILTVVGALLPDDLENSFNSWSTLDEERQKGLARGGLLNEGVIFGPLVKQV